MASYTGFASAGDYLAALKQTPRIVTQRAFLRKSFQQQDEDRIVAGEMKRVLGAFDLVCLGIGFMLGAGVFVTTGSVAATSAGPAVILSYLIAGVSALLSSLCYAEFSANMPLAGGAYAYVSAVFGEYLAWITVTNLILEYILANAAVIRGFSPYFAMLINKQPEDLVMSYKSYTLDWFAFGWVLIITVMLVLGTKESAMFNLVVTIIHVVLVVFIIIAGLVKSNPDNARDFTPFGVRGIFDGAAIVFFSFIGFDAVACSAEEVRNPKRDLPLGILGALSVVTACYILMSAALVMMVPYNAIDGGASFAAAFDYVNLQWARYIVALGAILGIVTGILIGMYAVSRIIASVARQHLLPPVLAKVHPRFKTPYVSTILSGVATAIIALFTSFDELIHLVSISTLFAFWIVALGLLWWRYYSPSNPMGRNVLVAAHLFVLVATSLAFTICYHLVPDDFIGLIITAVIGIAAVISMWVLFRQGHKPASYCVPLFPLVPAFSVALNTFLLGQLNIDGYIRFGIWTAAVTVFYIIYSSLAAHAYGANRKGRYITNHDAKAGVGEVALAPAGLPGHHHHPHAVAAPTALDTVGNSDAILTMRDHGVPAARS